MNLPQERLDKVNPGRKLAKDETPKLVKLEAIAILQYLESQSISKNSSINSTFTLLISFCWGCYQQIQFRMPNFHFC